ncbi:Hypothetical predicted protein [Paramuricea clavata]|nr:Hypothetical predicted protein [Paramuricea clavata]
MLRLIAVFVLVCLFNGLQVQALTCLCTGSTCANNVTTCTDATEICYAAVIRLKDGNTRIEKGCKDRAECTTTDFCPVRAEGSVCAKFGCCTYGRCVANYTLGVDFETPTPSPTPSTTQKPLMAKSSSLEPSSSVVPMTTKPEMAATSTDQAKMPATSTVQEKMPTTSTVQEKMAATSTVQEKMPATSTVQENLPATSTVQAERTSEPVMPTPKMTAVKPMTSAQPEMKSTKESMMPSVQIAPSGSTDRIATKHVFNTDNVILPQDTRPTCSSASGRVFSLGAFVPVAIGLLCGMF